MSENNWQGRNPAGSRNGGHPRARAWRLALLALVVAGGHRLLRAAPATPTLEVKETERVTVRHSPADGDTATVQKVLRLQLRQGTKATHGLVMAQKLPLVWQLSTPDFVPVVRIGKGDPQRLHGAVTGTGADRVAEVRLPALPGKRGETLLEVTYGARLKPVPKLPYDATVALAPKQLQRGKANRVTVTLRLGRAPTTSPGGLHATLWAPPNSAGPGYRVVTPPKGFAAMDGCGTPGTTGGLWLDPAQPLKWVLQVTPNAPGKTDLGTVLVTLTSEKPLVPSPTLKVTPEADVHHVGTYTLGWCETVFAGGKGASR